MAGRLRNHWPDWAVKMAPLLLTVEFPFFGFQYILLVFGSNSVTFFRAIGKYAIVILKLMTEFIKKMFEYFRRSVAFVKVKGKGSV